MIKPYKRVHAVGLELEGAWRNSTPVTRHIAHDGSVVFPAAVHEAYNWRLVSGEIASPPLYNLEEIHTFLLNHYPVEVNETCGFHMHLSFSSPGVYERLLVEGFTTFLLTGLREWAHAQKLPLDHPIWERLQGDNRYCRTDFHGHQQIKAKRKDYNRESPANRYTAVNYCYLLHGTIEIRVLPMFKHAKQAFAAVQEVLRLVNKFLYLRRKREPLQALSMNLPPTSSETINVSV